MKKEKKYAIEVSENQLGTIIQALEVFSRIGTKQYSIALDIDNSFGWDDKQDIEQYIRSKEGFPLPPNASYGINSHEVDDVYRVAWDLKKVMAYTKHWANHDGDSSIVCMDVDSYKPSQHGLEPLAKCKVKDV